MPDFVEVDYKNPSTNKRIRRKIKSTKYQAQLLEKLLETILNHNLNESSTVQLIRTNNFYAPFSEYLENAINLVYFNYLKNSAADTASDIVNHYMPLNYGANFCLLGKAGVGKSTLIKKLSCFWNNEDISFPFTDTSRTTTYPTDYCFVPKEKDFKFFVHFISDATLNLHLNECIERAINKMIDLNFIHPNSADNEMDQIFEAFVTDPTQSFDIRYSLGKYIKTTSSAYSNKENGELIDFWKKLHSKFNNLIEAIKEIANLPNGDASYYQLLYSDALKQKENNDIRNAYTSIYDYIYSRILSLRQKIIENVLKNPIVKNPIIDNLSENHQINSNMTTSFLYCELDNESSEDFYKFIQIFTAKKAKFWGNSLFNLVSHLRIEISLNQQVKDTLPQKDFAFVIQDTIGIAHTNDKNGGFENSTQLKTDNLDAIILIDDSRFNGDNNIAAILQHLAARIDIKKIHFAFSFFDELIKEDFDEDDLNAEKINYLISTETNSIRNTIQNETQTTTLIQKLHSDETCFLAGLTNANDFVSVQNFINMLIRKKLSENNDFKMFKPDPNKAFIEYDYRKIPLLYDKASRKYHIQQNEIYMVQPPHYKTTEALTRRLAIGETYFCGARVLKPVDDLYNQLITSLSDYIDNPQSINIASTDNPKIAVEIIAQLKALITEELRKDINAKFLNSDAIAKWKNLWLLTGIGSDFVRRKGIIAEEKNIAPDIDCYLSSTVKEHLIDTIQEAFENSIEKIANQYSI